VLIAQILDNQIEVVTENNAFGGLPTSALNVDHCPRGIYLC
jgi:hypothetical protein